MGWDKTLPKSVSNSSCVFKKKSQTYHGWIFKFLIRPIRDGTRHNGYKKKNTFHCHPYLFQLVQHFLF